jgi:CHAT domain-containing protein
VLLLEDAEATTDKVKTEMKARNWVHFACHGIQDADEPLKSGVHLHDGRLELLEIMREQISNPEFAFLSACQTSKGDLKLSDEVVHLAAGMLAAGYRGVVGTMWSISDMHGPEFATEFYKYLLAEKGSKGLDSTRAAYALDHAVRKVRESLGDGDAAFLTWVPYVHFGY